MKPVQRHCDHFLAKGIIKPGAATASRGQEAKLSPKEEFHAAIGRFVLEWAGMEVSLDLLLLAARLSREATQRTPKLPHQFAEKIALIRSEIKELDSAYWAEISVLLDEISSYADTRHDFVHGSIIGHYIEQGVVTATLGRLLQPQRRPRRKPVKVTAREITETSDRIGGFGDRLLDIAEALVKMSGTTAENATPIRG
jgi:hypothetical protein